MSEKTMKRASLSGKKRYVAIAVLAGLVGTGGVVGATVTTQSTIANNQISITKQVSDAAITASGTPLKFEIQEGASIPTGWAGATTYTLKNNGETDATVKVQALEGVNIPGTGNATFMVGGDGAGPGNGTDRNIYFSQAISGGSSAVGADLPITVPAGQSVKLNVYIQVPNDTTGFTAYNKTFDVKFDYINKQ